MEEPTLDKKEIIRRKSHILFVNNFAHDHTGSPKSILNVITHLNRDQFVPFMIVNSHGPLLEKAIEQRITSEVVDMIELSKETIIPFLKNVRGNLLLLKKYRIDLVHVNYLGWRDSIVIAAKLLGKPVVLHVRNNPAPESVKKSFNVFFADKIIAVSNKTRNFLNVSERVVKKTVVVHNAIEIEAFATGRSIRSELNLNGDQFVVGLVGQICERKGLKYFIEMAALVLRHIKNVRFLVVGKDATGEDGYTEKMKKYAESLNIYDRVIFTGLRNDVPDIMNSLDILITPSLSDPFPRVVLEAMAAQKCVVGSCVDGIPEAIRNGVTGVLVPPKDAQSIADAVIKLLTDGTLRKKMAEAAFKRSKEYFDMPVLVRNLENLYSEFIN